MNALKYYVSTTRIVLQGDPDTPSTWQDLYRMLPTLRNSLSCTVCESLLVEPYTPEETSCEHHVCKSCKGGVKTLRPTCSWCKDYSKYSENVQLRILIQNYKKLCGLLKINRMWGHIIRNGEQGQHVRDIISESEGERKGIKHFYAEKNIKVEVEDAESNEEVVEEEIVNECEMMSLGLNNICHNEPPDEIISSPVSKLNIYRNEPSSTGLSKVKMKLAGEFEVKKESVQENTTCKSESDQSSSEDRPQQPAIIPPIISTSSPPNVQKYIGSSSNTNKGSAQSKSGIRKIKAEAFILNPLKSKSDFSPQFRKLDSTPKVIPVLSMMYDVRKVKQYKPKK